MNKIKRLPFKRKSIKLSKGGEKEKWMNLFKERLIECGWKDDIKGICREFVKKKGRNNVSVDDLIHLITSKGRASIPNNAKAELLQRIQAFIKAAAIR
ncbi:transcription and mRNA export factor ENY2-like [Amaranthus tricolor]|uniref:transcription and mRNA export factor ENY2-like n=1 Tax=Amaranthus tricolor TaxID=29722 RepID=UPI0025909D75|nr:transcription and mRNA export factor ENY2-like [Amaranthus tricolor]